MSEKNPYIDGIKGVFLEPYYMMFKEMKYCPNCEHSFSGYYVHKYMNYCHTCKTELEEKPPIIRF